MRNLEETNLNYDVLIWVIVISILIVIAIDGKSKSIMREKAYSHNGDDYFLENDEDDEFFEDFMILELTEENEEFYGDEEFDEDL